MSENRFDDAALSAIIDGEADDQLAAAVHGDEVASQRLQHMRTAVEVVATEPEPASSERRSASIAAAMAAATPASPEVTSLAAARHERAEKQRSIPRGLIAAVAAAVALIVAIPIALSLGGGDTTDFASEAASTAADETASADVLSLIHI